MNRQDDADRYGQSVAGGNAAAIKRSAPGSRIQRRWIGWTILALLAAVVVWLVFFYGVVHKTWKEEVELAPVDVIVVERRMKFVRAYFELFQSYLQTRFSSLRLPDGTRFETEDRISLVWLGRGAAAGTWILIAVPNYCEEFRKYGLTDYVQFEYADGRWSYRPIEPQSFGRSANLLLAYEMATEGGLVTLGEKSHWNSRTSGIGSRYLQIERDQRDLAGRTSNCTEGWKEN